MITLFLLLIAAPIYLLIAGLVIGVSALVDILPVIIGFYLLIAFLAVVFAPLKPWYDKHHDKIKLIGNLILFVLFGPLAIVLTISIIALPFVMIYAIAEHPFIWYAVILFFISVFCFSVKNEIKRQKEEKIWEETRERAALHKQRYFYNEKKYTKED